jgi:hypothetical protein
VLAPTESFEAMQVNLDDWFAPLAPGTYRLQVTFGEESGVGSGTSSEAFFTIGAPDPRPR